MSESRTNGVIGVDGGGTSCRFALLRDGQRIECSLGAANVSTDHATAIATLQKGMKALAEKAGMPHEALADCPAYLGLAGVMTEADTDAVAAALPFRRIKVADDRASSVIGALGSRDGAVAAIGTGSFVARRTGDDIRAIGGWGLVLDDRAAGAWLGRGLLSETLSAVDGLQPHSGLTEDILAEFGGAAGIVAFSLSAGPGDFAKFAPRVVAGAAAGDPTAQRLMSAGVDYVDAALAVLGWTPLEPLCLIGGVGPSYAEHLGQDTSRALIRPEGNTLDGALSLAAQLGGTRS